MLIVKAIYFKLFATYLDTEGYVIFNLFLCGKLMTFLGKVFFFFSFVSHFE